MTREEISAMEPGRKLDELVMTTIFEARRAYYGEDTLWYHYDNNGEPDYEWCAYNSPSTDISAAWEAWDLGREDEHLILECKDGEYCATIHRLKRGQEIFDVDTWTYSAKTKEEAMIKCRLLTVLDSINLPREEET